MTEKEHENLKEAIQKLIDTQGRDGNWNHSDYMHGMFNGMILIQSVVTGNTPTFRDAPEKYLLEEEEES